MKKILQLCDRRGLVKPIWNGSSVTQLKFGPVGEFLVNNVRQEWFLSNVISRDDNMYPISSHCLSPENDKVDIREAFFHINGLCKGQLPFGIAQTVVDNRGTLNIGNDWKQPLAVFNPQSKTHLRSILFVSPNDAIQKFYTWQQKRKMWWRKFSSYPGRFSLSDIQENSSAEDKSAEVGDLRVNILADFDWGTTVIETIHLYPLSSLGFRADNVEELKAKDGRKVVLPCIVECTISLDIASFVFLCDAYSNNSERELLRLHRRLAPFKAGFVASMKDSSVADRLREIAKHMSGSLRQSGLSSLLLPDIAKKSLDSQLSRNDEMGIPFTIVLSDSTLTDGITRLYSRETTLKEQS